MTNVQNLDNIESKLTEIDTCLNDFTHEITRLTKDNMTETHLGVESSKYNIILENFSNEINNLKELISLKLESASDNNSDSWNTENSGSIKDPNQNVRKRYVEKFDKIDEDQCTEPETQTHDNGKSISTDVESKFSFYKILLSGFFFALICFFFLFLVNDGYILQREHFFLNLKRYFQNEDDCFAPF